MNKINGNDWAQSICSKTDAIIVEIAANTLIHKDDINHKTAIFTELFIRNLQQCDVMPTLLFLDDWKHYIMLFGGMKSPIKVYEGTYSYLSVLKYHQIPLVSLIEVAEPLIIQYNILVNRTLMDHRYNYKDLIIDQFHIKNSGHKYLCSLLIYLFQNEENKYNTYLNEGYDALHSFMFNDEMYIRLPPPLSYNSNSDKIYRILGNEHHFQYDIIKFQRGWARYALKYNITNRTINFEDLIKLQSYQTDIKIVKNNGWNVIQETAQNKVGLICDEIDCFIQMSFLINANTTQFSEIYFVFDYLVSYERMGRCTISIHDYVHTYDAAITEQASVTKTEAIPIPLTQSGEYNFTAKIVQSEPQRQQNKWKFLAFYAMFS